MDICKIETGKLNANAAVEHGEYRFFTTAKEISNIDKYRWDTEALLVAGNANVGDVKHYDGKFDAYQRTYVLTNFSKDINVRFLYFAIKVSLKQYLKNHTNSAAMTYIVLSTLENFKIPVPSMPEQERLVATLDKFDALVNDISVGLPAELTARRSQYEYYRGKLLTFNEYVH